jgi:hypothetical protein
MRDCVVGVRCGSGLERLSRCSAPCSKASKVGNEQSNFSPIIRRICVRIACKTLLYTHSTPLHSSNKSITPVHFISYVKREKKTPTHTMTGMNREEYLSPSWENG